MTYSTDPVADAYRHTAFIDAETEALEELTRHYAAIIKGVLTNGIRLMDHQVLSLPCVAAFGLEDRVCQMPLAEAIEMEISSPLVLQALMNALRHSECQHVESLRQSLADSYASANADLCANEALS